MIRAFISALLGLIAAPLHAEVLEVRGDRIFVSVEVNGEVVEALLDSGAEVTVFDKETADRLHLTGGVEVDARGTGANSTKAKLVTDINIRALDRDIQIPVAAIMDLSDVGTRLLGGGLPLILGREIFDSGRLLIDIDGARIDWVETDGHIGSTMVALTPAYGIETIPVDFGHMRQVAADFDLGNGSGLLISSDLATDLGLSMVGLEPAGGIGGSVLRPVVFVPEVTIAGKTFHNVRAHVSPDMQVPANIGVGLLRSFLIVTDFPEKRVWLSERQPRLSSGENVAKSREGWIETPPGSIKQWFRIAGKQTDIPIVLLHGGPGQGSQTFQASVGPELEKFATVVYFDQRGSGRSERPSDPELYSIPVLVADIDALLDHVEADRVILLGHSFGSILALEYAAKRPERVAGLVLTGAVPDMPALLQSLCDRLKIEDPIAYSRAITNVDGLPQCQPFAAYDDERRKHWVEQAMFPDLAKARQVEEWDNAGGLGNSGEMANALWSKGLLDYRFDKPERLTMPLLFIDGALDRQTAEGPQEELAAKVVNGSFVSYPRAGHFPFVDDPIRFARDVQSFMNQLGNRDE